MIKQSHYKRMVPLLLSVVLIIGVLFFYYHGKALKASAPDSLVSVTVENKAVPNDSLATDKETVELAFKAKDTDIFELPYDDTVSIVPLDEEGQEIAYPQLDSSDFKKSQSLNLFEERLETEQTGDSKESKNDQETKETTNETGKRLPYYQVRKDDNKGIFYFELEKDQIQKVRVTRLTKREKVVDVHSLKDATLTQSIVVFQSTEELKESQPEIMDTEAVTPEEQEESEVTTKDDNEEVEMEGQSEDKKVTIDPQALSATTPFKVDVDLGKTTGVLPFDTKKEPGYDTTGDDDIVRTFDQVSYRVMLGISNINEKYTSLKIRLDTELEDSWRKDSSGQIRQTAEIANGTVTDTGNGTKKSTRSSWVTLDKATGQAYFTETMETFGGVNGDQLKPRFIVTIESATLKNGGTETIDQVIDGSVVSHLNDTVYVSAKPYVDIQMAWTDRVRTTFDKLTGSADQPDTMVTNVAAYAQLKPLPGRSDITLIKGSTYPVGGIEYDIDQKMLYSEDDVGGVKNKELQIGKDTRGMQVIMYDGLYHRDSWRNRQFTEEYAKYESTTGTLSRSYIKAPVGYTKQIFEPNDNTANMNKGIYDTGNPKATNKLSSNSIHIENLDYVPISIGKNKWFVNLAQMPSNAEPFSVINMAMTFPYEYLEKQVDIAANINYQLSISKVKYEGVEQDVSAKFNFVFDRKWPGSIMSYSNFMHSDRQAGYSSNENNGYKSSGDGFVAKGEKIYLRGSTNIIDIRNETGVQYLRWNANSFEYDTSRSLVQSHTSMKNVKNYWGIGNKVPNVSLRDSEDIENSYTWYSSVTEAKKHGDIVAVKTIGENATSDGINSFRVWAPLKVIGVPTEKDEEGNGNLALTNSFSFDNTNKAIRAYPPKGKDDYLYTKYNSDAVITRTHHPSGDYGDTLYITQMTIRPTLSTDKKTYAPDETVTWTADGKVESGSSQNHKVQFEVTIPKETQYTAGTAKDYKGNALPDPIIIENGNGTRTLRWILDYMAKDSTYNPKIVFDTTIISSKLDFVNNVANLNGKVIADIWLESDETERDTSDESFRTSTNGFTVTNSGVIVVDKVVDKTYIESGNETDPAKPTETHPTDFTYTVSFKNHSAVPMQNVRVLDVLPYMGDQRGTDFNGSYSLTNVKQMPGSIQGTIWYTNNFVAADIDPNAVVLSSGWYKLGSDMSVLKNAKAIMAVYDELDQGKDMSISLTLRPTGQKAGDKYINAPSLNSHLNKFVQGVPCGVRVYSRDLSGVAWYDDNLDGLIGNKTAGGAEDKVKDIPVKLYRTSFEVPSYKKELVKESLTGEKFVDASGDSVKKTDANGKYLFENLPEGDYIAEFIIGDKVVQREVRVTKQLEGSDEKLNSKADQESYQTPKYEQPILSEVAGSGTTDGKNHVTDVNLGLIRPSTIRLFKYATGTATDANNDGELTDPEKATGTPLKDAEFDVYEGDANTPFATETTDDSGNLNFAKLFPGEHTLIETKAPNGYELIKNPIKVTITEGNQTIQVYAEDDKKTDLPFTGGNGPLLAILLTASGALVLGFGYMLWYFRIPKKKGGR